jgi:hypothetical protein
MLDVIVCSATLHKHIHNFCTTLDGLDSDHRAVSMALNLTSIKYKVKLSMNCGNILMGGKFSKRMSNINSTTSVS